MSQPTIRNLDYIRQRIDPRLADTLADLVTAIGNISQQTNSLPNASPAPPPNISSLTVSAANGVFDLVIQDNNPIYRGICYFVEFSTTPNFSAPRVIFLGPTRNHTAFLGSQTLYWRAYSAYLTSPPSSPVYFGTAANPTAVAAGGAIAPPAPLASAGSGTSTSKGTQGGSGFGSTPYRGTRPPSNVGNRSGGIGRGINLE